MPSNLAPEWFIIGRLCLSLSLCVALPLTLGTSFLYIYKKQIVSE